MPLSIGLVTLNAKFIHSSLSLRYLRNAARNAGYKNVWVREYIINQPTWKLAAGILEQRPDVLGVSIYIWNRAQSFELIDRLKKQDPSLSIVVGGPEVSFDPLSDDYILISGEGEKKWVEFLEYQKLGETPPPEALERWSSFGTDLPDLITAYDEEDLPELQNRIAYLETSRGCPYLCSFCLSALDQTVRYFDDEAVRRQIKLLIDGGTRQIKFIDRTFNLKPGRMAEWIGWLSRFEGVSFHFEVVGDLLTPELMDCLDSVPKGMFQFEIGIQTTQDEPQRLIQRKQDNEKLFATVKRLVRKNRVHIHSDLIFGLPGENLEQSLQSFTEVCRLRPHELQLGFLKFLPGAPIRKLIDSHEYRFQSGPPYEILSSRDLSAAEVIYLKKFTDVFDQFYNSKKFRFSIDTLLKSKSPVKIFDRLLEAIESKCLLLQSLNLDERYRIFFTAFDVEQSPVMLDTLKLDYLYAQRIYRIPNFLTNGSSPPLPRQKTWKGDGKTPMVAFNHEIREAEDGVELTPSPEPRYYAIVHPDDDSGYLRRPAIKAVHP
ncbi:MAG: DUF4080 domain-containing protein [Nitrospinaceae bacterium]